MALVTPVEARRSPEDHSLAAQFYDGAVIEQDRTGVALTQLHRLAIGPPSPASIEAVT
jgi:hypothetical protein